MIQSYLSQLQQVARETGVPLLDGVLAAGINRTTIWRWCKNDGASEPRHATAEAVDEALRQLARKRNG